MIDDARRKPSTAANPTRRAANTTRRKPSTATNPLSSPRMGKKIPGSGLTHGSKACSTRARRGNRSMAKKRRTAKQRAATRKMIAANRAKRRGGHGRRRRRRNPIAATETRRRRRRHRRRRNPIAATETRRRRRRTRRRRRNPAAETHRRRRRRHRRRRSNPLRKRRQVTLRSARKKGRRRSKAVIRTRPRSGGRGTNVSIRLHGVTEAAEGRRRRRRRHRRRNPLAATEARHHRRRHHRRHHHRRHNPISGMREFGMGILGLAIGGLMVSTAYRFGVTHPLNSAGQDAPAQGQVYNAESLNTPIWKSGLKALGITLVGVIAPFGISSWVKSSSAKSFWQLAGFGGLGFVGVKTLTDVAAWSLGKMTTPNQTGLRLLAPEIMATSDQNAAALAAPQAIRAPSAHTTGTAGLPRLGMGHWGMGFTVPPGSTMTPVSSAAACPPGSSYIDAGMDGRWCVTPPSPPPPTGGPPPPPPPPPPPGGGPPSPPPMTPPGMCPPGPPSPPAQTVCLPAPPGTLTPPYAQGGGRGGACCDTCARGGRCSCPINSTSDYLSIDMERA